MWPLTVSSRRWFVAAALLVPVHSLATDAIPPHIVGVWASENAVLKGPLLLEGEALYLGADGIGALVAGPPPVGVRIMATFDSETNRLEFEVIESGNLVGHGIVAYDPKEKTMDSGSRQNRMMRRRLDEFTNATKEALGLEISDR